MRTVQTVSITTGKKSKIIRKERCILIETPEANRHSVHKLELKIVRGNTTPCPIPLGNSFKRNAVLVQIIKNEKLLRRKIKKE